MTLQEEDIQICVGEKEEPIAEVKQEFKSSLQKPSESTSNLFLRGDEENFTVKKEIGLQENYNVKVESKSSDFCVGNQTNDEVRYDTEFAKSNYIESHQSAQKLKESFSHNFYTLKDKDQDFSESKNPVCDNQFNDLTSDTSDVSQSSLSPKKHQATKKHQGDVEYDINDGKELSSGSKNNFASPPPPTKQKLRNTKRRAGILYKQITNSKLCKVTSKYFSHIHNNNEKRWIPPRSPYALVQEDLFDNPWQLLVATIFLTKTTAKKALPQLHKFLARYPRPEDVLNANYEDIDEYFKPLGLTTTRSHIIMRFTVEFLEKDWTYPRELYGIGKYGDDSYRMFCVNEWRQVSPDDIPLTLYRNWLLENAERLGIE